MSNIRGGFLPLENLLKTGFASQFSKATPQKNRNYVTACWYGAGFYPVGSKSFLFDPTA
jgi:hypothetical protein